MSTTVTYTDDAGALHMLRFDGVISEKGAHPSTITTYPVEKGSPVGDNIRDENPTLSLSVKMTDTPMHGDSLVTGEVIGSVNTVQLSVPHYVAPFIPTPGAISGAITGALDGAISKLIGTKQVPEQATVLTFSRPYGFVSEMYYKLLEIKTNRWVCTVSTTLYDYVGFYISDIEEGRGDSSNWADFDITFSYVKIIETQRTSVVVPAEPSGKKKVNGGKKDPVALTKPQGSSVVYGLGGLGGIVKGFLPPTPP